MSPTTAPPVIRATLLGPLDPRWSRLSGLESTAPQSRRPATGSIPILRRIPASHRVSYRHVRTSQVRKVPQLLTIVTSPSASIRRSAATTVLRATPYSLASCATDGSRSCDCHSPALIRARSADSTRWLGSSGVRSDGIQT
jgi:hypothetical protein